MSKPKLKDWDDEPVHNYKNYPFKSFHNNISLPNWMNIKKYNKYSK